MHLFHGFVVGGPLPSGISVGASGADVSRLPPFARVRNAAGVDRPASCLEPRPPPHRDGHVEDGEGLRFAALPEPTTADLERIRRPHASEVARAMGRRAWGQ